MSDTSKTVLTLIGFLIFGAFVGVIISIRKIDQRLKALEK